MQIRLENIGKYKVPPETRGGKCLEIGANVGSFTEKYKDHFGVIHYYEPVRKCFEIIQGKIKSDNIVGFNLACAKRSGNEVEIIMHQNNDSGSCALKNEITSVHEEWDKTNVIQKVQTISLEDCISKIGGSVDYCKSDCETSEYNIFYNQDLTPIKYLAIEIHHQIGIQKWRNLLAYIQKTHGIIKGNVSYSERQNKEFLFKRKQHIIVKNPKTGVWA
jgi:FkbM family methyltransferase